MNTAVIAPPEDLQLSQYDYDLPRELIAQYPLATRDSSRMLVLDRHTGQRQHRSFTDLLDFVAPGDLVVVNNTRVLPARLWGHRQGHTGRVEIFLLHPHPENPYRWTAMMKPTRKLALGTLIEFPGTLSTAEILSRGTGTGGEVLFHLVDHPSVASLMEAIGELPIPPYLDRPVEERDKETYQTVFSKVPGAHAAPTAGLHFTPQIMEALHEKGVGLAEITLAVSTGTFRSVHDDDITHHQMDPEYYMVSSEVAERIQQTKVRGNKVIAIGTTVAKTLETVAQKYQGTVQADTDWSRLFIYPGFQFQVVDHLLTNFHLPKTTLLMLISAFSSRPMVLEAYQEAVEQRYRFFSYGDCMLIL